MGPVTLAGLLNHLFGVIECRSVIRPEQAEHRYENDRESGQAPRGSHTSTLPQKCCVDNGPLTLWTAVVGVIEQRSPKPLLMRQHKRSPMTSWRIGYAVEGGMRIR